MDHDTSEGPSRSIKSSKLEDLVRSTRDLPKIGQMLLAMMVPKCQSAEKRLGLLVNDIEELQSKDRREAACHENLTAQLSKLKTDQQALQRLVSEHTMALNDQEAGKQKLHKLSESYNELTVWRAKASSDWKATTKLTRDNHKLTHEITQQCQQLQQLQQDCANVSRLAAQTLLRFATIDDQLENISRKVEQQQAIEQKTELRLGHLEEFFSCFEEYKRHNRARIELIDRLLPLSSTTFACLDRLPADEKQDHNQGSGTPLTKDNSAIVSDDRSPVSQNPLANAEDFAKIWRTFNHSYKQRKPKRVDRFIEEFLRRIDLYAAEWVQVHLQQALPELVLPLELNVNRSPSDPIFVDVKRLTWDQVKAEMLRLNLNDIERVVASSISTRKRVLEDEAVDHAQKRIKRVAAERERTGDGSLPI
ncbi:hypothetical protein F4780DRAFT_204677 [Xylariomycetidae sp. FL0641]|nr:hypothetical protein F4780DRAFT_204677 [Xylariomycetidae sp. FL0641]